MKKSTLLRVMFFLLCSMVATGLWAQGQGTGSIEGTVTDSSGAVIPGVKIVIQNLGTNATREMTTDASGHYRAELLSSGEYSITASQSGFTTTKLEKVTVFVGTLTSGDLKMAVAGTQQTVEVTAEAPLTDAEKIAVGGSVGERAIEDLPVNGRRWSNFVLLTPGTIPDGNFGLVSYRGISGLYNNNSIDGADDNQAFFSEANGRTRTPYAISQATIKEFQVGLSNYSAEYGRAAGGTVNAVTKSGSNQFHGEGFYFLRTKAFQAMDRIVKRSGVAKPDEKRQQFGGAVGGPLIKDKLFIFGNYDEQLRDFPITVAPNIALSKQVCTVPGCAATLSFLNTLVGTFPRQGNNYIFLTKLDWIINQNNTLMGEYNYHKWHSPNGIQTAASVTVSPSANGSDDVRTDLLTTRLTSVLTGNTVNEFRFQWGRDFEFQFPNAPGPSVFFTNGISYGQPNFLPRPAFPNEKKLQFADNYSFIRGNHSFKAGMDIVHYNELLINLFSGGGVYTYGNSLSFSGGSSQLNALAADCPAQATGCVPLNTGATTGKHYSSFVQAFDLTGQNGKSSFAMTNWNFYFQDNWRVRPSLTLYLGVRYEFQHLPQAGAANPKVPLTGQINQDTNNWAPRFGFSWDLFGNHKTVLRGGYGIYYGVTSGSYVSSSITGNGMVQTSLSLNPTRAQDLPLAPVFPNILTTPGGVPGTITLFDPNFVEPLIHSADLAIERELANGLTISGSYLFSRGLRLFTTTDLNLPPQTGTVTYFLPDGTNAGVFPFYSGARPNAAVGAVIAAQSVSNSTYHGFVFSLNKRFSHGVQIQSNFTLSKAIDNGQTSSTFIPTFASAFDQNNRGLEKGLSGFDARKRWVTNFLLSPSVNRFTDNAFAHALFNDWQFSGVLTLSDGKAFTPSFSGGSVGIGGTNGSNGSFRVPFLAPGSFTTPGYAAFDMRFARNFRVGEKAKFQFIWEGFNLFNRVNYTSFAGSLFNASSKVTGSNNVVTLTNIDPSRQTPFLQGTGSSSFFGGSREFQLGLKFIW